MFKINNNAIDIVLEAASKLYPETKADIWFGEIDEGYGCTTFPDDGGIPQIIISIKTPLEGIPEIIAHEIAHVIAGVNAEHNIEWDKIFTRIQDKYIKISQELFGHGEQCEICYELLDPIS